MQAIQIQATGGTEVLQLTEAPLPMLADGQVLIQVHAAGVNPVDAKTRRGAGVAANMGSFPWILGWDVSGVVVDSAADVESFQNGEAVFGMIGFPQPGRAYAQYAAASVVHLAPKPTTLSHVEAAALPLATLTAWQAIFETAHLAAGQSILIHAGAGGVGHLAIQLAKWKGAIVTTTASSHNLAFLEGLGVDQVVDYTRIPFETVVPPQDVVLDTVGGEVQRRSFQVVKPGGHLVTILAAPPPELAVKYGVQANRILVRPEAETLNQIRELVDAGHLRPHLEAGSVFPLDQVAQAHTAIESQRTRGKIVLQMPIS
ncbi:MAG: NADP-dependent oxidoreductase [Cyanobacteriota bacterium]|nr:NADP-dependent oxidoreductase [Cyanobacteriota bacterium]